MKKIISFEIESGNVALQHVVNTVAVAAYAVDTNELYSLECLSEKLRLALRKDMEANQIDIFAPTVYSHLLNKENKTPYERVGANTDTVQYGVTREVLGTVITFTLIKTTYKYTI